MGPMGHMGLMWDALGISHISPISLIGPIRAMLPLVPVRRIAVSPHRRIAPSATFHACNVRARVMKTPIDHSDGADLNHELEKENFSMDSGNGGSGSHRRRYRGI